MAEDWTPERIAEARARCEAATKGPWEVIDGDFPRLVHPIPASGEDESEDHEHVSDLDDCIASGDRAFIAAARVDLPTALDEIERLQRLVERTRPYIEAAAEEQQSYGYFLSGLVDGDPRCFSPDEECATPAEIAQHKADCEAWERGERPRHVVMQAIDPKRSIAGQLKGADSAMLHRDDEGNVTGGHVHRAGYGMGVTTFRDPEAVALLAALEASRGK